MIYLPPHSQGFISYRNYQKLQMKVYGLAHGRDANSCTSCRARVGRQGSGDRLCPVRLWNKLINRLLWFDSPWWWSPHDWANYIQLIFRKIRRKCTKQNWTKIQFFVKQRKKWEDDVKKTSLIFPYSMLPKTMTNISFRETAESFLLTGASMSYCSMSFQITSISVSMLDSIPEAI